MRPNKNAAALESGALGPEGLFAWRSMRADDAVVKAHIVRLCADLSDARVASSAASAWTPVCLFRLFRWFAGCARRGCAGQCAGQCADPRLKT